MSTDSPAHPEGPGPTARPAPRVPIDSRSAFQQAVREALAEAARVGCRELVLVDPDFSAWPLGEAAVIESLAQWAYAHRRLTLLAARYDEVIRHQPRFVRWRVQYAHVVEAWTPQEDDAADLPSLLHAPGLLAVRLFDAQRFRGAVDRSAAEDAQCRERVDAFLQRACESFPASTVGL
jgi:hypothetical protein